MSGENDLEILLRSMHPRLSEYQFVFCTILPDKLSTLKMEPLFVFREKEGATIIIEKRQADSESLDYDAVWSWISLTVHSSLSAIGFLAAITAKLSENRISVNVVSAYFHDHLFVPQEKASLAMQVLVDFQERR
ncbi:MAG: ACT domain-containing protein [Candidatus Thorarchaeota archaeon]